MSLANTLGVCLLLLCPRVSVVPSVAAASVWDVARPQENQSSDSSPQSSSPKAPAEAQKPPDRSTPDRSTGDQSTAPQPASGTTPGCPKNSQPNSSTKTGCNHAAGTKAKKQPGTQKPAAAPPATPGDPVPKRVVKNGSTEEPKVNLSPDPSPRAPQQVDRTRQLLDSSEANLKKISVRPLNESQQETVKQINSYMEQSKAARDAGDVQRAYNLAVKANLLSAELAGH